MSGGKIIKYILTIVLLCSCGTPRNVENLYNEVSDVSKITAEKFNFDAISDVDFSSTKIKEIVFKKVEYFPPDSSGRSVVKSEENLTIKQEENVAETVKDTQTFTSDSTVVEDIATTKNIETAEEVAKDPYRWRYIFGIIIAIIAVAIVVYIKLKGSKIISSICTLLKF